MTLSTVLVVVAMIASAALAVFMLGDANWRARDAGRALAEAESRIADLTARLDDLRWLHQVWDTLPDGIIVVDADESVQVCNRRARDILQAHDRPRGCALAELTTHAEVLNAVRQALQQGGAVTGALAMAPGVFVDVIANALEHGGALLVLQDACELSLDGQARLSPR